MGYEPEGIYDFKNMSYINLNLKLQTCMGLNYTAWALSDVSEATAPEKSIPT